MEEETPFSLFASSLSPPLYGDGQTEDALLRPGLRKVPRQQRTLSRCNRNGCALVTMETVRQCCPSRYSDCLVAQKQSIRHVKSSSPARLQSGEGDDNDTPLVHNTTLASILACTQNRWLPADWCVCKHIFFPKTPTSVYCPIHCFFLFCFLSFYQAGRHACGRKGVVRACLWEMRCRRTTHDK